MSGAAQMVKVDLGGQLGLNQLKRAESFPCAFGLCGSQVYEAMHENSDNA